MESARAIAPGCRVWLDWRSLIVVSSSDSVKGRWRVRRKVRESEIEVSNWIFRRVRHLLTSLDSWGGRESSYWSISSGFDEEMSILASELLEKLFKKKRNCGTLG